MTNSTLQASKEESFLQSALTPEGEFTTVEHFLKRYRHFATRKVFAVHQILFSDMDNWCFADNPYRLMHRSGRFFSIEGIRVKTNYGLVPEWDQPIINQPEIGILGIITKVVNGVRYFLMQCKMEPGNVNIVQLSPTVQATKSNYKQVHKGRQPLYLEYFTKRNMSQRLIDQLQTEQGARFLYKRNRNMIVEVTEDLPVHDRFCWLTLGQIKRLLAIDNLVNMDARTVISCIPIINRDMKNDFKLFAKEENDYVDIQEHRLTGFAKDVFFSILAIRPAKHTMDEILSWFTELKTTYNLRADRIPLNQVRHWVETDREIQHETGQHFSVIAVSVQAENREVISWKQPLLKHSGCGLIGFLVQKIDGTLHFLVRASVEPGNINTVDMGPTVSYADVEERMKQMPPPHFLDFFITTPSERIHYSVVQSEEGGRFYHFQNRSMIVELPANSLVDPPEDFIWMTLGQIFDLVRHGYFNIEARNLLACLNLLED